MVRMGQLSAAAQRTFLLALHHEPLSMADTPMTTMDHADQIKAAANVDIRSLLNRMYRTKRFELVAA